MHHLRLARYDIHLQTISRPLKLTSAWIGISDAYYCAECTRLEKDRDGCPKIVNLGASRTDLFYERRRLGKHSWRIVGLSLTFVIGFKKG